MTLPDCPTGLGRINIETNVLAAIAELAAFLEQWEQRWTPGDMGAALSISAIPIAVGEVGDSRQVEGGERHVGWVSCWEAGFWEFVPATVQLRWSQKTQSWVDLDTIRAENAAVRDGTP